MMKRLESVDVHLSHRSVPAREMNAVKLLSVLQERVANPL